MVRITKIENVDIKEVNDMIKDAQSCGAQIVGVQMYNENCFLVVYNSENTLNFEDFRNTPLD